MYFFFSFADCIVNIKKKLLPKQRKKADVELGSVFGLDWSAELTPHGEWQGAQRHEKGVWKDRTGSEGSGGHAGKSSCPTQGTR